MGAAVSVRLPLGVEEFMIDGDGEKMDEGEGDPEGEGERYGEGEGVVVVEEVGRKGASMKK